MDQPIIDLSGAENPFLASPFVAPGNVAMTSQSSIAQLAQALHKSVDAGFPPPDTAPGSLSAMMPESLEGTITSLIWDTGHLKILRAMKKQAATNTVHQFVRLLEHGHDLPPFVGEGLIPDLESDPNWERVFERLKVAVRLGRVTDIAGTVQILGPSPNAVAEANKRTSLSLLGAVEDEIYFGDSTVNALSWDGIWPQMLANAPAENVVDLRGDHLTPEMIDEGVVKVLDNAGDISSIWMPNGVRQALGQIGGSNLRLERPANDGRGGPTQLGVAARSAITVGGEKPFEGHYFLQPDAGPKAAGVGGTDKPATPAFTATYPSAAGTGSKFAAGDQGDYIYKVVAVGPKGKSIPLTSTAVAVTTGQEVTVSIDDKSITDVIFYVIYRSEKDGLAPTCKKIGQVVHAAGVADTVFVDTNEIIPGMTFVFGLSFDPTVLEFAQLGLPAVRVPLAKIDLADRFAVVMVGTVIVKAPTKLLVWYNCNPNRITT